MPARSWARRNTCRRNRSDAPGEVDHRADIYALGVVFYQMLTGELPGKKIEPPSKKVRIDVRLDEVVLRALEKQPELRYQQASVLKTQVETIATTAPDRPSPEALRQEQAITWLALILSVSGSIVCLALAVTYPRQAAAPLLVMSLSLLGIIVCGLCFAGVWPLWSPLFPRPNFCSRNLPDNRETGWEPPAAGWGWFVGRLFGVKFTSPKAYVLANTSALGFLGFWSYLQYLPVPWANLFACLGGFYGFFGLAGFAFAVEFSHRSRATGVKTGQTNPLPVTDFWQALEEGNYARAWEKTAPYFQQDIRQEEWVAQMEKNRRPLGKSVNRKIISNTVITPMTRTAVEILATFANGQQRVEGAISAVQPNGEWRVEKYYTRPVTGETLAKAYASQPGQRRFSRAAIAGLAICLLLAAWLGTSVLREHSAINRGPALADSPWKLQQATTAEVILAGLGNPRIPWAWQELEKRPLTTNDVAQIMNGLDAWLWRNFPKGCPEALGWQDNFLDRMNARHLITDEQKIRFLTLLHGDLPLKPQIRLREGVRYLSFNEPWRWIWREDFLGFSMMNALSSIKLDGQPVQFNPTPQWNQPYLTSSVTLPRLAPGKYILRVELLSALAAKEDLAGLSPDAPPSDWPAKKRWTRAAEMELDVYARAASMVDQTRDPALDPVRIGNLNPKPILIRSQGGGVQAVVSFDATNVLPVTVSFDVTLQAGGQTVACGQFFITHPVAGEQTLSAGPLSAWLPRLGADIDHAEVILTQSETH